MSAETRRYVWTLVGISVALWLVVMAPRALMRRLEGKRIVGKAVAGDGSKLVVVQTREWMSTLAGNGKRYSTYLYVQKGNGKWRGFYGNFEDGIWKRSDFQAMTNRERVVFYRQNVPEITYYWGTEKFELRGRPEFDGSPFDVVPMYDPMK